MPDITFVFSAPVATRLVDAMKGLEPVPIDGDRVPLFTDAQWAKERIRRWIKQQIRRWEKTDAANAARQAAPSVPDGDIT